MYITVYCVYYSVLCVYYSVLCVYYSVLCVYYIVLCVYYNNTLFSAYMRSFTVCILLCLKAQEIITCFLDHAISVMHTLS